MLHTSILLPPTAEAQPPSGRTPRARRSPIADNRADALWRTAPWLACLSAGCTLVVLWGLADIVPLVWLGCWAALMTAVNVVIVRARRRAAGFGTETLVNSSWWSVAEAAVHAGLLSSLPAIVFAGQSPATQAMLGAAMGTMMAGAFLLAIVPLAASLWVLVIAGSLIWGLHAQGGEALGSGLILLGIYSAVVIAGCLTVERLLERHARAANEERLRGEAMGLLLREYEEQGAGWLWQTDVNHQITYVSPRLCERFGRSTAQMKGQLLPTILGGDAALARALATQEVFTGIEMAVPLASGECWMSLSASPILGPSGAFQGFRGLGTDVTEARRAEERIRRVALVDDLTGLPNRQQVRAMLSDAIEAAERRGGHCALLFADLDGFKPINDRYGHAVGDVVLRTVARRLATVVGARGQVGRLGGDEFAIIVSAGDSRQYVEELGQRLITAIAAPVPFDKGEATVGLSIGCMFAPTDGETVDELLVKADIALYQAKSQGRGRIAMFDHGMQRDSDERTLLEHDLRLALTRNELRLEYQPVVAVATQAIIGFEALLRWAHPSRGLVPPLIFLPIAEECGLIGGIAEWVIRTACADAAEWPGSTFVSINLSRSQIALPGLATMVSEALLTSRLQPSRLELEVTETVFQDGEGDESLDVLRRLRALGVGIALDDFGSGHSSLGYLNRTIFHTLKLDGSFVRDAAHKSETLAVIRAIVALATGFRMDVTAEGIESFEDYARMRELGCQRVQGYLFGRPAPCSEAMALLTPPPLRAAV